VARAGVANPANIVEIAVSAEIVPTAAEPQVTASRGELTVEAEGRRITLGRRDQRALGLTRASVRRVLRELRREGWEGDREELAYEVQDRLYQKHAEAWEAVAREHGVMATGSGEEVAVDWDGLLDFLEALIPIIERLLEIFDGFFAHVDPGPVWLSADCDRTSLAA